MGAATPDTYTGVESPIKELVVAFLETLAVLVVGFVGCAEFASMAFVHPVIRTLDPEAQLVAERGLLGTFGRIMPVGMTAAFVLALVLAIDSQGVWLIAAATVLGVALAVTIAGNVPINARTGRIAGREVPEGFLAMRRRWDVFQAVRASLQLVGFVLVVMGVVAEG